MRSLLLGVACILCANCAARPSNTVPVACKTPIGEVELYAQLRNDPFFANGIPPPGMEMRVEREACGYRIYIGVGSTDSFGGSLLIVNSEGHITQLVSRP